MDLTAVAVCGLALAPLVWFSLQLLGRLLLLRRLPPGARLPPMPPAGSLRGHVEVQTFDFPRRKALEWAKLCGPVYRLKLNGEDIVVLNDFHSVKTFLNKKEILDRARHFAVHREYFAGLGTLNGELWRENRKFCMSMLRDLGFARTIMEDLMMDEFGCLDDRVRKVNGEPINIYNYIQPCASNNIASFFYARRLPSDHPSQRELQTLITKVCAALQSIPQQLFCPRPVRWILNRMPFTKIGHLNACMNALDNFTEKRILDYKADQSVDISHDFIHRYGIKIEETKQDPQPLFTHRYLVGNVTAFIMGGTVTTTMTMWWHLLVSAKHPDTIQASIQREIDEVVGSDRRPTWEDRKLMPYTLACIWEMHRWKTVTPLGSPRESSDDVLIDGYFIAKGTTVLPNLWAVHNDPTLWKDPHRFNPQRFLNDDGTIVSHKPEHLIPFGIGRRSCPGEVFASMEIFLMLTFLLQKYRVAPEHTIECDLGSPDINAPAQVPTKLLFLPRHH